jgi:hypothetical protein
MDERAVASETKLPQEVIRFCARRGIVHPRQVEGRQLFTGRDVLHLKLFRCVMYSRFLGRELEKCWRKAGDEAMVPANAAMAGFPKDLLEVAEEALRSYRPIS